MKYIMIVVCCMLTIACSSGVTEVVDVTITEVYGTNENSCIGEDVITIVKTKDGRVDRMCGRWAKVGDTIRGCWTTGHWDHIQNGFRVNC